MRADLPLGRQTEYPDRYAPEMLCAVARADHRRTLGLHGDLPFGGEDVWTAYDLTWLETQGKPAVASAVLRVPASSPQLIESKSLKLYLNSLAMTRFDSRDSLVSTIASDLSRTCGGEVDVTLTLPASSPHRLAVLPGICIDDADVRCDRWRPDPSLLANGGTRRVAETLHSHLLRSVCPVTGQPDIGSILIRYCGLQIDHAALLRYLISYREHAEFHENCVERIFVDLRNACSTSELSVYARYNRRGGLDINPFRSDTETRAPDLRLWRQ